jgi:hypothetical protein
LVHHWAECLIDFSFHRNGDQAFIATRDCKNIRLGGAIATGQGHLILWHGNEQGQIREFRGSG